MAVWLRESERVALGRFAAQQGRQWRIALRRMWEGEYYGTETDAAVLDVLKQRVGVAGLAKIRPADLIGGASDGA